MPTGSFDVQYSIAPSFASPEGPYEEPLPVKYPVGEQPESSLFMCATIWTFNGYPHVSALCLFYWTSHRPQALQRVAGSKLRAHLQTLWLQRGYTHGV